MWFVNMLMRWVIQSGISKNIGKTYERYPALVGGFIWDWVDQSIKMPAPDGSGYYMASEEILEIHRMTVIFARMA